MRRWMAAPVVFAAAAALTGGTPTAHAQPPAPEEVSFVTADGVRLKGLFHKSQKAGQGDPVVVLMYPPGAIRDPNAGNTMLKPGDWGGLAAKLNEEGYHVFRFDWRGHGSSTDITDTELFWTNPVTGPWNQRYIRGARSRPVKNTLIAKNDFLPQYFPAYVNDLAAVRMFLDQLNDNGSLNTSSIYLLGAEESASLGMLWITSEWNRPAIHPTLGLGAQYKISPTAGIIVDPEAGRDVAGAIWLSPSYPSHVPSSLMADWAKKTIKLRDNNPMLFLYGKEDSLARRYSEFFYNDVLVAEGNPRLGVQKLEQTFIFPIEGTKLRGAALLGNNAQLKTEDRIVEALKARQKDRQNLTRKTRSYVGPYFIDLGYYGLRPR